MTGSLAVRASFLLCTLALAAGAVDISIDEQTEHQTMVGFGGSAAGWSQYAGDLVNDLGMTVVRYDWSGFTGVTLSGSKYLYDAGVHTFIASCWSPPANMKTNSSVSNGGSLKPESYGAFVDWCVTKVNEFKQTTGSDLYAISIQNEPAFVEFYASCVYTPQELRDVTKRVGERFERDNIKTKIFMSEEVFDQFASLRAFTGVACSDTATNKYIHALAFHGLGSDGISPSDLDASRLREFKDLAVRFGKTDVWNTEAGGGGLALGRVIYKALRYADLTLWTKYDMCGDADYDYYIKYGQKTKSYNVAKMYYRYVRPGAVRIETASSDTVAVLPPVAFHDKSAQTLTVVFATGSSPATVRLQGTDLPAQVRKLVTDGGSKNHEDQGLLSTSGDIQLEANAIVTLTGTGYNPPAVGLSRPGAAAPSLDWSRLARMPTAVYSLDGREVLGGRSTPAATGYRATAAFVTESGVRIVAPR